MNNAEVFLAEFNQIDHKMKDFLRNDYHKGFSEKVDEIARTKSKKHLVYIIKKYRDDLKQFAALRNILVHERTEPGFYLAEPHDFLLHKIEEINKEMDQPKRVIPKFQKKVMEFQAREPLEKVLKVIKDTKMTQYPVYFEQSFEGLISANGVMHWLSQNFDEEIFSVKETTLNDVIHCEEERHNYYFVDRDTTVYEAEEIFQDYLHDGKKLDAILITENGKDHEKLLGLISYWDVIDD